jgi:antitoxin component HigA of HigAB toxin-antitoxin module
VAAILRQWNNDRPKDHDEECENGLPSCDWSSSAGGSCSDRQGHVPGTAAEPRLWRWPRHVIDIRDFTTQYSAYSVELEASIGDKGKVSTKLNPRQLQQVSEAMQSAREFRKYVVAGYNSCGITKTEYGQYGARFQALDNLARGINELLSKGPLPQEETKRLADLIKQYGDMVKSLGS